MKRSVDFKSRGVKLFPGKDNSNKFSICESTLCYYFMVNLCYSSGVDYSKRWPTVRSLQDHLVLISIYRQNHGWNSVSTNVSQAEVSRRFNSTPPLRVISSKAWMAVYRKIVICTPWWGRDLAAHGICALFMRRKFHFYINIQFGLASPRFTSANKDLFVWLQLKPFGLRG